MLMVVLLNEELLTVYQIRTQLAGLLLIVIASGCGGADGPEIASVRGTIKMDGEPLPNATVLFIPQAGGRPAGARTDENGEYELNFGSGRQGAIPGENKVRISTLSDPMPDEEGNMVPGSPEKVPRQFNTATTLTFTVEDGKENIADFDISSEGELPDNAVDPAEAGIVEEQEEN